MDLLEAHEDAVEMAGVKRDDTFFKAYFETMQRLVDEEQARLSAVSKKEHEESTRLWPNGLAN